MAKAEKTTSSSQKKKQFLPANSELLSAGIAEMFGSFVLMLAVLNTQNTPFFIALVVIALVLILSKASGGHINPLVTLTALVTRHIAPKKAAFYFVAQFLGVMLAVTIATKFIADIKDPSTDQTAQLFMVTLTGTWKPFFAELLAALILGFGAASVFVGKKQGYEAAITIGGSILVAAIVTAFATMQGPAMQGAISNPAVALGVKALDFANMWTLLAYVVAPIIGVSAGAFLYKLLQADSRSNS